MVMQHSSAPSSILPLIFKRGLTCDGASSSDHSASSSKANADRESFRLGRRGSLGLLDPKQKALMLRARSHAPSPLSPQQPVDGERKRITFLEVEIPDSPVLDMASTPVSAPLRHKRLSLPSLSCATSLTSLPSISKSLALSRGTFLQREFSHCPSHRSSSSNLRLTSEGGADPQHPSSIVLARASTGNWPNTPSRPQSAVRGGPGFGALKPADVTGGLMHVAAHMGVVQGDMDEEEGPIYIPQPPQISHIFPGNPYLAEDMRMNHEGPSRKSSIQLQLPSQMDPRLDPNSPHTPMSSVGSPGPRPLRALMSLASFNTSSTAVQIAGATVREVSRQGIPPEVLYKFADGIDTVGLSTQDVVEQFIAPETEQLMCRFIDLVPERKRSAPTHFIVHCWSAPFDDLVDAVRMYLGKANSTATTPYIWLDLFCVNLHPPPGGVAPTKPSLARATSIASTSSGGDQQGQPITAAGLKGATNAVKKLMSMKSRGKGEASTASAALSALNAFASVAADVEAERAGRHGAVQMARRVEDFAVIRDLLASTDCVLFVLDRLGKALTRTWVLWELWQASLWEHGDKIVTIPCSWAWGELRYAWVSLDVGTSQASSSSDRGALMPEMRGWAGAEPDFPPGLPGVAMAVKDALLKGSKKEVVRSERLGAVQPTRMIWALTVHAQQLFLGTRYTEAEDVLRVNVGRVVDKANPREVPQLALLTWQYHLALVLSERGATTDTERLLQQMYGEHSGLQQEEVYQEACGMLVDVLTARKQYTRAEMLCRKLADENVNMWGPDCMTGAAIALRMASIALAQKLHEEAEESAHKALELCKKNEEMRSREAGEARHVLARCLWATKHYDAALQSLNEALECRVAVLGSDHPSTLETKELHAFMLEEQGNVEKAEALMHVVVRARMRTFGTEHHHTLTSMGKLADLQHRMGKVQEAEATEQKVLKVGKALLQVQKLDQLRSLKHVAVFASRRDGMLEKASMFMTKAYVVVKDKLGAEHEVTHEMKALLAEMLERLSIAAAALVEQAQGVAVADQQEALSDFVRAELLYKQAYAVSKLVLSDEHCTRIAEGLAEALFGQGKVSEAKGILRNNGLSNEKAGMKQSVPASYLRWVNMRVVKYMDKKKAQEAAEEDAAM